MQSALLRHKRDTAFQTQPVQYKMGRLTACHTRASPSSLDIPRLLKRRSRSALHYPRPSAVADQTHRCCRPFTSPSLSYIPSAVLRCRASSGSHQLRSLRLSTIQPRRLPAASPPLRTSIDTARVGWHLRACTCLPLAARHRRTR